MSSKGRKIPPPTDHAVGRLLTLLQTHGATPYHKSPHGGMSRPVVAAAVKRGLAYNIDDAYWGRCARITDAGIAWLAEHPTPDAHTVYDTKAQVGWLHNGTWYAHLHEITEEMEPVDYDPRTIGRIQRVGLELLQNVGPRDLGALTFMRKEGLVRPGELTLTPEGVATLGAAPIVTPELVQALTQSAVAPRRAWRNCAGEVFTDFKTFAKESMG